MFAGGGAVLPQQMMPQQMMPQQMMPPQQSGGILASSGPLLDAVAAGAINPDGDGGASLSDVQGFANGGLSTSQDLPYITRYDFENQTGGPSDRPDSRFLPESGVTTDFSAQLTGATDEQLRQFISSVDPITQGAVLSQAQAELDRRSSLVSLNTQPVNSLTPLYDVSDNAEDQAEGFSGQDADPGGMTGPGFSNFWDQDPKTSFTISGIKESHPARSTVTQKDIDAYNAAKSDISFSNPQTQATMDIGYDATMGPSAGGPSDGGPSDGGAGGQGDDTEGVGEGEDGSEGPPAADGGYFTSRMYNANSGQSGYPNMTAAEEIENGVQRFRRGGSIGPYNPDPRATYDNNSFLLDGQASTRIVPEQIANPQTVAEMMAAMSETGLDTSNADDTSPGLMERIRNSLGTNDGSSVAGKGNLLNAMRYTASPSSFMGSTSSLPGQPIDENEPGTDPGRLVDVSWETNTPKPDLETMAKRAAFDDRSGRENTPIQTIEGFPTEKGTELTVSPVSAEAEAAVREAEPGSEIDITAGDSETAGGASFGSSSDNVIENEFNRIQQSVVEEAVVGLTEASNKEDTKTGMTDFINDFKSAMPEYEGMSESEKGFAIMEAGLRIMAGKSSDALTNIAEGLKGLGPKFAKDAKDKRAWNRQIDLSAAKYALSSVEKLRTEEKALAAEGRKRPFEMMTTEPVEIDGVLVPRGTAVPLTNQQITDGYIGKFKLTYRESFMSNAAALAKLAATNAKSLQKPGSFSPDREKYLAASKSFKNGLRMKSLLMEAANIAIPEKGGEILGAVPLFKSWVDKGFNAAGYQNAAEIDTFRSDKPEQYKALVKTIGTTMVTEILNETNKTVSDGDRQRVEELVAAYSDFDGTVASYKVLKMKLSNLEKTIDTGISSAANAMSSLETQWKDAKFIGGGTAAETMASIRNFSGRPVSYSFGDRSSKPIPYKDIINMKTRKFTPKYQNIFGKKVPK